MSDKRKMPTDAELQQIGRSHAVEILQSAVSTAKIPEQLNGQLHATQCMAIHIIATNLFNQIENEILGEAEAIMAVKELIEEELEEIRNSVDDMETVEIK